MFQSALLSVEHHRPELDGHRHLGIEEQLREQTADKKLF
jgi:hypothetical protein